MKTCVHLRCVCLSLEWELFQTQVIEKVKTHILCSITFSLARTGHEGPEGEQKYTLLFL
jgi:hypothetical protein